MSFLDGNLDLNELQHAVAHKDAVSYHMKKVSADLEAAVDHVHKAIVWYSQSSTHALSIRLESLPRKIRNMVYTQLLIDESLVAYFAQNNKALLVNTYLQKAFNKQKGLIIQTASKNSCQPIPIDLPHFVDPQFVGPQVAREITESQCSIMFRYESDCRKNGLAGLINSDPLRPGVSPKWFLNKIRLAFNIEVFGNTRRREKYKNFHTDLQALQQLEARPGLGIQIDMTKCHPTHGNNTWNVGNCLEEFRETYDYLVKKQIKVSFEFPDFQIQNRIVQLDILGYFTKSTDKEMSKHLIDEFQRLEVYIRGTQRTPRDIFGSESGNDDQVESDDMGRDDLNSDDMLSDDEVAYRAMLERQRRGS